MSVDFGKKGGRMKPVASVNIGAKTGVKLECDFTEEYRLMNIPTVRTHSASYPCSLDRFIDIHSVFPDFSLDENLETSYSFAPLDAYFSAIKEAGCDIFLRIGESPDPFPYKPFISPPLDIEKWARVAEHIIAHYNEGWASGFKFKIKYCEIWADADDPSGFSGSAEEFYELYRVCANHLKSRFPKLKIGGYSSGGFYSLNHPLASAREKSYVDFLENFLRYIKRKESEAPLDFLTWKCKADNPEEISLHANYARAALGQFGFNKTESIVSEFNLKEAYTGEAKYMREYPSALASSLIIAEKSSIAAMFYSDLAPYSPTNAIFTLDDGKTSHRYAAFEVMRAFGELYALKTTVDTSEDYRRELYLLAAADKDAGGVLLSTRDYDGILEISVRNSNFTCYSVRGIIGGGERGRGYVSEHNGIPLTDGRITLRVGKNEVYYINLK